MYPMNQVTVLALLLLVMLFIH